MTKQTKSLCWTDTSAQGTQAVSMLATKRHSYRNIGEITETNTESAILLNHIFPNKYIFPHPIFKSITVQDQVGTIKCRY